MVYSQPKNSEHLFFQYVESNQMHAHTQAKIVFNHASMREHKTLCLKENQKTKFNISFDVKFANDEVNIEFVAPTT